MQGLTALHMAAHQGHSVIVNQLCRVARVQVDALDNAGCTPLHHATALGHDGVVMELWSKSANVDLADANGWTGSCATLWSLLVEHLVIGAKVGLVWLQLCTVTQSGVGQTSSSSNCELV